MFTALLPLQSSKNKLSHKKAKAIQTPFTAWPTDTQVVFGSIGPLAASVLKIQTSIHQGAILQPFWCCSFGFRRCPQNHPAPAPTSSHSRRGAGRSGSSPWRRRAAPRRPGAARWSPTPASPSDREKKTGGPSSGPRAAHFGTDGDAAIERLKKRTWFCVRLRPGRFSTRGGKELPLTRGRTKTHQGKKQEHETCIDTIVRHSRLESSEELAMSKLSQASQVRKQRMTPVRLIAT